MPLCPFSPFLLSFWLWHHHHHPSSIYLQGLLVVSFLSGQTVDTLSGCRQELSGSLTLKRYRAYLFGNVMLIRLPALRLKSGLRSTTQCLNFTCNFAQSWFSLGLKWHSVGLIGTSDFFKCHYRDWFTFLGFIMNYSGKAESPVSWTLIKIVGVDTGPTS